MKTVFLDFTADKNYFTPMAHITDENVLLKKWEDEVEDRKEAIEEDGVTSYPGPFVRDEFMYNNQSVVRVNLSFPLYEDTDNKLKPKNIELVRNIAAYVISKLEINSTDTLHFVLAAHGVNGMYNDYYLSTGNKSSPKGGLLPSVVLAEVIKQFTPNDNGVEITLLACNLDKGKFVKNFATSALAKRFNGNIKINRFEGIQFMETGWI